MARLNVPPRQTPIYTHEGARAPHTNPVQQLRRSVMACMLWEDTFYEDGKSIADRISGTILKVAPHTVADVAVEAREKMKLRHVPLLLAREMSRYPTYKDYVSSLLERIIQRPDELTEFLAIYWKDGRQPVSAQVKKGLARACRKFDEYQLAKYDRDGAVKLRDVLRICHPKPVGPVQTDLWKRLLNRELRTPDTWEVNLSAGADKKETWERLLNEKKLGGLALLRNLRNMQQAGVTPGLVRNALAEMRTDRILPFRFISAAKYAPQWEPAIESAMLKCLQGKATLPGKTAILVDGSGSMFGAPVSAKSEIDRFEAACGLAILAREICEDCVTVVFSYNGRLVPARRGFALRDALYQEAERGLTHTQNGILVCAQLGYDRIIIITDEQSYQIISNPLINTNGYVINVNSHQNGIGYGRFTHIDGWSEAVLDYIAAIEQEERTSDRDNND